MTAQADILSDPNYRAIHDHGFVGLVDHMGSDAAIVQAARVSYGAGTKSLRQDRGLIRYLMRKRHTSPIEMAEVKLHIRCPIFVMRQLVRHRTASLNEYSGRYSIMTEDMYWPEPGLIQPQSTDNKQGRAGSFTEKEKEGVRWMMKAATDHAFEVYEALHKPAAEHDEIRHVIYDVYSPDDGWFDPAYQGLARELARTVLPLSSYTELYWKQDLHNLLHLLKLRRDTHAQQECRDYAEAIYTLVKPLFPLTVEAWEDYVWHARTLSRMDVGLMRDLIDTLPQGILEEMVSRHGGEAAFAEARGYAVSELREFRSLWGF